MKRALLLAEKGVGRVSPSPLVGCVIASPEGEVLGEGFYVCKDVVHAEAVALEKAGGRAKGATAYVSLEPHHHHSRTPPCTVALLNAGITRVFSPIEDPNPLVAGKGFEFLRQSGVEVITNILKNEAEKQNEKYIHWHRTGRPFVHLKLAISLDGRIATRTGDSRWITGETARERVQEIRHEYDAILVGANTVIVDNPMLSDRSGKERGRPLVRVILDNSLRVSLNSHVVLTSKETPTLVFTDNDDEEKASMLRDEGVDVINIAEGGRNLVGVLQELGKRDIQSVLVEGGAEVAGAFFDAKLIDKITFFIAPVVIGGRDAPTAIAGQGAQVLSSAMRLKDVETSYHDGDLEITGYPETDRDS